MPTGGRYLTSYPAVIDQKSSCDIEMIFVQNCLWLNSDDVNAWPLPNKIPGSATEIKAVVLKPFALRRLWNSLVDLRRTSNMNLIKVLFIDETTKRNSRHLQYCDVLWVCLFSLVSRIMEEFVKLPSAFPSQSFFVIAIWF